MQLHLLNSIFPVITSTFLHSLWQGLLAALLASLILTATRRASSSWRYLSLCALFILFLGGVFTTFVVQWLGQNNGSTGSLNAWNENGGSVGLVPALLNEINTFLLAQANWVITIWAIVFLYKLIRIGNDLRYISRLRSQSDSALPNEWIENFNRLTQKIGIKKSVELAQSPMIKIPVIVGHLKPMILLPIGVLNALPPKDVEAVLLHELAHIRRHDYLVNFLQCLSGAVFFFNPGFIYLSSLMRQERENCCDDVAIKKTNDKASYVAALISFKEYSLQNPSVALGLFGKQSLLFQRISRIVSNTHRRFSIGEFSFIVLSLILLSLLVPTLKGRPVSSHRNITAIFQNPAALISSLQKNQEETPELYMVQREEAIVSRSEEKKSARRAIVTPKMPESHEEPQTEPVEMEIHNAHAFDNPHGNRRHVEEYRAEAEKLREQAEQHRQLAEEYRQQSIRDRIEADEHRRDAEEHRLEAERHRRQVQQNRDEFEMKRRQLTKT